MKTRLFILAFTMTVITPLSQAIDSSTLPKKKQTKPGLYLTAKEAHKLVSTNPDKILFIDIRTRAEVNFLGMPTIADANIPYMRMDEWFAWDEQKRHFRLRFNSRFSAEIAKRLKNKGLNKGSKVILIGRSGSRSAKATNLLTDLGYKRVYSVVDGYEGDKAKIGANKDKRVINGWRNAGLPWSYKLAKAKMYLSN